MIRRMCFTVCSSLVFGQSRAFARTLTAPVQGTVQRRRPVAHS
jgi:hypothetical protein